MSTSRLEARRKGLLRTAALYAGIAVFCGIFSVVYLQFSYGVKSPFLVWLFVPPLLLGALPALWLGRHTKRPPVLATRRLWNSAVATLTTGFLVRAVINISGRYTDYDGLYWLLAGALFAVAVVCQAVKRAKERARIINQLKEVRL